MTNVISINKFKNKKVTAFVDFVLACNEEQFVETVARAYIEYSKNNGKQPGIRLMESIISAKAAQWRKRIEARIAELR
jgi:hypothetical protein